MKYLKNGINSFQLKMIALIFMTLDHCHYMFSGILPVPNWFSLVGRIAAPIFIFLLANGIYYTHNMKKYMLRLYIGGVIMSLLNTIFGIFFVHPTEVELIGNIFETLFLICFFIHIMKKLIKARTERRYLKMFGYIVLFLIPIISGFLIIPLSQIHTMTSIWIIRIVLTIIPNVLTTEGGISWIILGIGFYFCKREQRKITAFYICFVTIFMLINEYIQFYPVLKLDTHGMMFLALPLILLYNGNQGKKAKYLFYLYYPLHMYLLYFVAIAIGS